MRKIISEQSSRVLLLISSIFLLLPAFLFSGCGGDDPPPNGPVVAVSVSAINGTYYKQDVSDSIVSPALQFAVLDNKGNRMPGEKMEVLLLVGDGVLSADSLTTDSNGIASLGYTFSDSLGHAVIRARRTGIDSAEVILRKNMIVPEVSANYILLDDNYGTIKALLGAPDILIVDPSFYLFHAVYESSLGFVVILTDIDKDQVADDNETVSYLIVNDNEDLPADSTNDYKGKTREGIGIGSKYIDVRTAFGPYSSKTADLSPPPYWKYVYTSKSMRVFTTYNTDPLLEDSLKVREIHIDRPGVAPVPKKKMDEKEPSETEKQVHGSPVGQDPCDHAIFSFY